MGRTYVISIFILTALFAACTLPKKTRNKPGKFTSSECSAVMASLSRIYLANDAYCKNNKRLAGLEIEKLVNTGGCFIGQPFNIIQSYLGKPDLIGNHVMVYDILNQQQLKDSPGSSIVNSIQFYISKDSLVTGISLGQVSNTE